MKAEYFPPREDVILQNEAPSDFYILVTGTVVSLPGRTLAQIAFRLWCFFETIVNGQIIIFLSPLNA